MPVMKNKLQIIPSELLPVYLDQVPKGLQAAFDALQNAAISTDTFSFYTSVLISFFTTRHIHIYME